MVLGCQGPGYLVSPETLVSQDCTVGGLAREGNYLLGCLAGLLSGLLACWGAWKLAIWLPHRKYHGSGLPRDQLWGVPAALGKRGYNTWGSLAGGKLPTWLPC